MLAKDMEKEGMKVDFDKILQSLVTTMEHPDPFVRKVSMYWMSRIVKAHMGEEVAPSPSTHSNESEHREDPPALSAATVSGKLGLRCTYHLM